jgi:hypothetical protein
MLWTNDFWNQGLHAIEMDLRIKSTDFSADGEVNEEDFKASIHQIWLLGEEEKQMVECRS